MDLLVPTSIVLDLFGTGISDDSFRRFCIKGYCPVASQLDSRAPFSATAMNLERFS